MGEQTITGPRAVLVGSANSVFVTRTAEELIHRGFDIVVLDPYANNAIAGAGRFAKAVRMLHRSLRVARTVFRLERDRVAVILWLSIDLFWLAPLLKIRFERVVGVAFGSDILRRVPNRDAWLRFGLRRLDAIAATNDNVMQVILNGFPEFMHRDRRIIRFGLPVFDAIDRLRTQGVTPQKARTQLGYAPESTLISLGYSASKGQRQLELIDYFSQYVGTFSEVDFIVPVQYGSPEVIAAVKAACHRINAILPEARFHPLTAFHDPENSALMRLATKVLINHSISDAFSGTVQEVIYAGNLVLAAEHLPYQRMPGFGSAILSYAVLDECTAALSPQALESWSQAAREAHGPTREALSAISSWDAVMPDWLSLIWPQRNQT